MLEQLKAKYKKSKNVRQRRRIRLLFTGRLLKKYKMINVSKESLQFLSQKTKCKSIRRKTNIDKLTKKIQLFYTRDDVSRITTGKKQTITRKKIKMQKRLLNDTLKTLHMKFLSENPSIVMSYSFFRRLRPFYVVYPTMNDRETCQCKKHENLQFKANELKKIGVISESDLNVLAESIVCNPLKKDCMYRECELCKFNSVVLKCGNFTKDTETCKISQWVTRSDDKGFEHTVKEEVMFSPNELCSSFRLEIVSFLKHVYNIRHQYHIARELKKNIKKNECVLHIDFAENYNCKYSNEIQAVHFGGSHKQATLHTGILYLANEQPKSLCSISNTRIHDPASIWALMDPVLENLKIEHPEVNTIHFFSDGPVTQYRQKKNFFLFSNINQQQFQHATWNFYEASHGKGAADGVGAAVKRTADRLVKHGDDIPSALDMFKKVSEVTKEMALYFVDDKEVNKHSLKLEQNEQVIKTIPGTMKIHQLVYDKPGCLLYRDVSCICGEDNYRCSCFSAKSFKFLDTNITSKHDQCRATTDIASYSVGQWVCVIYDDLWWPGLIEDISNDMAVIAFMKRSKPRNIFRSITDSKEKDRIPISEILCATESPVPVSQGCRVFYTFCSDELKRVDDLMLRVIG